MNKFYEKFFLSQSLACIILFIIFYLLIFAVFASSSNNRGHKSWKQTIWKIEISFKNSNFSFFHLSLWIIKVILARFREDRYSKKLNFLVYLLSQNSDFCLLFDFFSFLFFLSFAVIHSFNQYTKTISNVFRVTNISSNIIHSSLSIIKNYKQIIILILEIWYRKSANKHIRNLIIFFFILNIIKIYSLTTNLSEKRYQMKSIWFTELLSNSIEWEKLLNIWSVHIEVFRVTLFYWDLLFQLDFSVLREETETDTNLQNHIVSEQTHYQAIINNLIEKMHAFKSARQNLHLKKDNFQQILQNQQEKLLLQEENLDQNWEELLQQKKISSKSANSSQESSTIYRECAIY